jgi:L-serine deaminase
MHYLQEHRTRHCQVNRLQNEFALMKAVHQASSHVLDRRLLWVRRRAPGLHARLLDASNADPLRGIDWVNMWALAVNEKNAGGCRAALNGL